MHIAFAPQKYRFIMIFAIIIVTTFYTIEMFWSFEDIPLILTIGFKAKHESSFACARDTDF